MDYISPNNNTDDCTCVEAKAAAFYRNPWLVLYSVILLTILVVGGVFTFKFAKKSASTRVDIAIVDQSKPQAALFFSDSPVVLAMNASKDILARSTIDNISASVDPSSPKQLIVTIKPKDNLGRVFKRFGLSAKNTADILKLKQASVLKRMRVGRKLSIELDSTKTKLKELTYEIDDLNTLRITAASRGWQVKTNHIEPTSSLKYASATINGSIYTAGKNAGVSRKLMAKFASIFSHKVNVNKIRGSARFAMFYKEYTVKGKKVRDNEIAAAELVHKGQTHRIIGFTDSHGRTDFYTPDGRGIKPAFIRYPLEKFKRIGSKFSFARKHPILGVTRPHSGVDFTANSGTPVRATSNGKIDFAGHHGGHGKTVRIKNGSYSTLYAHLSGFSKDIHPGWSVRKGSIIGYVGSSGLATGPHLHYEFHVNGVPHDPLKVKLPVGEMIAAEYRSRFFAFSRKMLTQLELRRKAPKVLAMNAEPELIKQG